MFHLQKPKFTTIADSESTADVTFGKVRPRQEVTEDIAICAVPSVAMGKFTLEQVKEWLISVSRSDSNSNSSSTSGEISVNFELEALIVYDYIAKLSNNATTSTTSATSNNVSSAKNKVELPKSSIFGSVTVSSRLKMYGNKGTANGSSTSSSRNEAVVLRAGQHLLRVNNIATALHAAQNTANSANSTTDSSISTTTIDDSTATVVHSKAAELLLREAVIRRSQYDASLLEYERVTSLQNTRMRIEDQASTNFQASVLQLGKHKNNPSSSTNSVKVEGSSGVSEKRSFAAEEATSSGDHAAKRIKTEPTFSATNNTSAVGVTPEDSSDFADFDLEDLVGGPVASANASKYANIKTVATTTNTSGSRPVVPKVVTTSSSSNGNHINSNNSNGVTIKQEGEGSSAHSATETKKVGSRPRPKFVIS